MKTDKPRNSTTFAPAKKTRIKRMKRKRTVGALLLPLLLLAGCGQQTAKEEPREYAVVTVTTKDVSSVDKYPATIRGCQDVEIYPQVSGRITAVNVTEGQRVRKGQTLFVIDQVPYRAALQTARANENAARAAVATAQLNYDGKKELHAKKVTSLFEVQKAHNTLLSAKAALEQAKAQVTDARNNLSYTMVSSPCNGVVGTLPYRVGALVSQSMTEPLTTVSDNSEMWVYFSIPENQMIAMIRRHGSADNAIKAMPAVSLYLNDGSLYEHTGRVESVSGVLDAQTGSISLRASFINPEGLLHSGGAGNVGLGMVSSGKIVIPQSATYELQDKIYVYRLVDGKAVAARIEAKAINEQRIYVVERGLAAGDVIIAEGVSMLSDGMPIKAKKNGNLTKKNKDTQKAKGGK